MAQHAYRFRKLKSKLWGLGRNGKALFVRGSGRADQPSDLLLRDNGELWLQSRLFTFGGSGSEPTGWCI